MAKTAMEKYFEYRKNPAYVEKRKAQQRNIDSNTLRGRFKGWKASAKKRSIDWNLSYEFIQSLPFICHYTGISLDLKAHLFNTVSLDRIDSDKGYEESNVVFCCGAINQMKSDLPMGNFIDLCEEVVKHNNAQSMV